MNTTVYEACHVCRKRNPATNLPDPNMFWDFLAATPESLHQVIILFSDRGTPVGYRHMNGYSSHTFRFVNKAGEGVWVKLHFKTAAGIRTFTAEEAEALRASDADFATRDLYEHLAKGDEAVWNLSIQVMTESEGATCDVNPFDITKVWPHKEYPLHPVGRLVLNRNPENYFVEVEQAAFSPGHLVPGIEASPDKMLQARLFSYPDTHRHRLGVSTVFFVARPRPTHRCVSHLPLHVLRCHVECSSDPSICRPTTTCCPSTAPS